MSTRGRRASASPMRPSRPPSNGCTRCAACRRPRRPRRRPLKPRRGQAEGTDGRVHFRGKPPEECRAALSLRYTGTFTCGFDLRRFPFDTQSLPVQIEADEPFFIPRGDRAARDPGRRVVLRPRHGFQGSVRETPLSSMWAVQAALECARHPRCVPTAPRPTWAAPPQVQTRAEPVQQHGFGVPAAGRDHHVPSAAVLLPVAVLFHAVPHRRMRGRHVRRAPGPSVRARRPPSAALDRLPTSAAGTFGCACPSRRSCRCSST